MARFGIGQSITRTEDLRFLTGRGQYVDDIVLPGMAHAFMVRSPYAHARIRSLDTAAAAASPGVLAVLTHADLARDGIGDIPCLAQVRNADGTPQVVPPRPAITGDSARHVGDIVAVVVAETAEAARDAGERVEIDYEVLPSVTGTVRALAADAAQVWPDAKGNLAFVWENGDRAATDAAFARAAHVTRVELVNNRIIVNAMEPRVAIGDFSGREGRIVLYASSQGSHGLRSQLANNIFHVPENQVHVITPDVGGGFGMKIFLTPEQVCVTYAARRLGRPVKWNSERSEGFISDSQGRDNVTVAELALDGDGRFLGVRAYTTANLGAYLSNFGPFIPTGAGTSMLPGVYTIPAAYTEVKGVFTHTVPVDAYRGAGRPEAAYMMERLVDTAARELGMDPGELRERNYIPPGAFPYQTCMGLTYDSGEYAANTRLARERADWAGFPARREAAARRGKLAGIGLAYYIEQCGGGGNEAAQIRFDPSGYVTLFIGSQSNGQGHETAYAQIAADRLGIPMENIRVMQGDSDKVTFGRGTGGSRAIPVGGSAVIRASDKVIAKGRRLAAHMLEAAEADIEFQDGRFVIAGTDRSIEITELAKASFDPGNVPMDEMDPGIDEIAHYKPDNATFPNGCHVCELEIDRDTGTVDIVRYTVVDDFGNVINPLLLAGQVHGGIAQGIGQALLEHCVYDDESGQLLSGSFLDYCLPRADDMTDISFTFNEVTSPSNLLGVKGCGEAGAIGAPPAVINALVEALSPLGVRSIDMPATPQRIWEAIARADLPQAAD